MIRGIQRWAALLMVSVIIGSFVSLFPQKAAAADWVDPFPATVDDFLTSFVSQGLIKLSDLNGNWGQNNNVYYFTNPQNENDSSKHNAPYVYYLNYVQGKDPNSLIKFSDSKTLQTISDARNYYVGFVDDQLKKEIWPAIVNLYDAKGDDYANSTNIDKFKADIVNLQKHVRDPLARDFFNVMGFAKTGVAFMQRSDVGSFDQLNDSTMQALRNGGFDSCGTGAITLSGKCIWKPGDGHFADYLQKDNGYGDASRTQYYSSPSEFYSDLYRFLSVLPADPNTITTTDQVKSIQAALMQAAVAMDGSGSAGNLVGDPCGDAPNLIHISEVLPYTFCGLVVQVRELGSYMIVSAGSLLAKTAGIPGGAEISNGKDLFSFVQGTALDGRVEDKLQDNNLGAISRAAYARVLNIVNGLVLLLLIGIALANILQVQISVYSFKKMLPGLIIGLILANSSYFIVRAGLELSGYVADGLITKQDITSTGRSASDYIKTFENFGYVNQNQLTRFVDSSGKLNNGLVFQQFVLNFFLWAAAIMILILAFLFAIRSLIFFLLVPLSPVAFIGLYFPPLGFAWKRWSALMISWIFMPVVAFFWLWLGFIWFNSVSDKAGTLGYFLAYVFGLSMIYLAMKTPFTLAGEAKQYVEKWNATGAGLGKRFTPYGAGMRGYNQIKKNMSERDKMLNEGLTVQNRYGRKLGGDKFINKPLLKAEIKTDKLKADLEGEKERLKNQSLKELSRNRMEFLEKWKNSNLKFVRSFAEVLDKNTKKFGGVMDKLVASGWMAPTSFAQRDAHIRDNAALSNLAKNQANRNLTESYYKEEMGVIRAQREFEAEAEQKSAEKTQGDAKMTAAYKNLTGGILRADPLIRDIAAVVATDPTLDPNFDPNMDLNKLMSYKMPAALKAARPDLARKLEQIKGNKNVIKSSAKHISSAQKSGMDDGAKKEVSEIAFGTHEVAEAGKVLDQLNATRGPDGKYDGVGATDIEDYTERFGSFAKKMAGANSLEKKTDAEEALNELASAVNAMTPGPIKNRYVVQLRDYRTGLAACDTSDKCKKLAAWFKTQEVYKDILGRVPGPAKNFKV